MHTGNTEDKAPQNITILAPLDGDLLALSDVPDAAFAAGTVGKGIAIQPKGDTIYAPGDGKVLAVQGHAIGIRLDGGVDVLIHLGVDTVEMNGESFTAFVERGDRVSAKQKLMSFDIQAITDAGYPSISPVLITNHRKWGELETRAPGLVSAGEEIMTVHPKL